MKGTNKNDFKLRQAAISSLAFCPSSSQYLNGIVEELLRHSKDQKLEVR